MNLSLIDKLRKFFGTQFVAVRNGSGVWTCYTVGVSPLGERYICKTDYPGFYVFYLNDDHTVSRMVDGVMHKQNKGIWRPL